MRLAIAIVICLIASVPGAATGQMLGKYEGRRVVDVLNELQADGARIVFSSLLVTPDLRIKAEPRGRTPRQIAEEILAPHDLDIVDGPGQTWLVVRATTIGTPRVPSAQPAPKVPHGPEPSSATPETPPIRIEEHVDVVDRFGDHPERTVYTLEPRDVLETAV